MDTRLKSIKPALAFLSFVLGVSLLLYSGAAWLYLFTGTSSSIRSNLADTFRSDYQQTATFRSMISSALYTLLNYAANAQAFSSVPMAEGDLNLLYYVEKNNLPLASNTYADLSSPDTLPEGYNFLLTFNGSTASIWKDGQELDVYGDGVYRGTE